MQVLGVILIFLEAGVFVYLLYQAGTKRQGQSQDGVKKLKQQLADNEGALQRLQELFAQAVDIGSLRSKAEEYRSLQEALKAERGRITITQAELETVEVRLRELEEIERELEASGLETKEELNILNKKKEELTGRNNGLKQQLTASLDQIDSITKEIELSSQMEQQVDLTKSELVQCQQKIDLLLLQIEEGNEQYFVLKKRYDALDIEYAQLFEKFSETEGAE
jgi:chromosome segregation ATPase